MMWVRHPKIYLRIATLDVQVIVSVEDSVHNMPDRVLESKKKENWPQAGEL